MCGRELVRRCMWQYVTRPHLMTKLGTELMSTNSAKKTKTNLSGNVAARGPKVASTEWLELWKDKKSLLHKGAVRGAHTTE